MLPAKSILSRGVCLERSNSELHGRRSGLVRVRELSDCVSVGRGRFFDDTAFCKPLQGFGVVSGPIGAEHHVPEA